LTLKKKDDTLILVETSTSIKTEEKMEERFETFTVLINRIGRNIRKIKNQEMAEYGLRSVHISCLYYLYANEGLTSTDLCERCEEDKATISRALDYLETNGYLFCEAKSAKRYKTPLMLTEKGFAVAKEISPRDLNLAITLIGAMAGIAIPQNNRYSKHANSPIPADIRANKKEGDEYYTIGDMLRKGSKRKVFAIAAIALLAGFLLIHAVAFWGGLGFTVKSGFDNKKACIIPIRPNKSELAELITIDPEAAEVDLDWDGMFRFHTQGGLVLTLKHSEAGSWTDVYTEEIREKEGILFVTGDPSSEIVFHIICDGKGQKFSTKSNDSTYLNKEDNSYPCILEQAPLNKETTLYLYYTDDEAYEMLNNYLPEDILKIDCPDGCYAVTIQDVK
jgi:DNA-binding MarR family transcriptional regulator